MKPNMRGTQRTIRRADGGVEAVLDIVMVPRGRKEINHQRAKLDADMDDVQARLARGPNTARERRILKRRRVSLRAKLRDPKNKSLKMWEYDVHQIAGHA